MGFNYSSKLYGAGGATIGDNGFVYNPVTDTLTVGTLNANNVTATALATPGAITVTNQGTPGGTTVTYKLVALLADGTTTEAGAASSTATSNATLSATNFNRLSWSAVTGATSYRVYRTVAPTSPATTGIVYAGTALTVDDTGLAGGGETPPTVNGTGRLTGNSLLVSDGKLAVPSMIVANAAYTIAAAGGDYATLADALAALATRPFKEQTYVTLTIADGTYTSTSPLHISNVYGKNINIQGAHTYAKTLSSIQSSSGSAGAWTLVLNLDSVTNVAIGDYVAIPAPTGGTTPTYLAGVFPVTDVDAVNTRITITSKHRAAAAPSGAVTGTVTVLKTVLVFNGTDGIDVWDGGSVLVLDKVVVVGNGTASTNGLSVQDLGRLFVTTVVGVSGFGGSGVYVNYGSEVNSPGKILSSGNGDAGFSVVSGGVLDLGNASGMTASGNGAQGLTVSGAYASIGASSIASGNATNGFNAQEGAVVKAASTVSTGNTGSGYYTATQAYMGITSVTSTGNTNIDINASNPAIASLTVATGGDYTARPKTLTGSSSSPYDIFAVTANGSTGGWQGAVDLMAGRSGAAAVLILRAAIDGSGSTGTVTLPANALTAGTMTATVASAVRSMSHRFTWTNAMVAALGANLAGDIKVATLPAKVRVKNAYVVITGAGAVVDTLTVAVGRTGAGYIDYIVASDAMAAANTVYGDASAERGTNLTGYDLPSYTGTTDVYAHFIATSGSGKKLADVTGSTGIVYLETEILP